MSGFKAMSKPMDETLQEALGQAREWRDANGRSEQGRQLAILATKIEDCLAWWTYMQAERQRELTETGGA